MLCRPLTWWAPGMSVRSTSLRFVDERCDEEAAEGERAGRERVPAHEAQCSESEHDPLGPWGAKAAGGQRKATDSDDPAKGSQDAEGEWCAQSWPVLDHREHTLRLCR